MTVGEVAGLEFWVHVRPRRSRVLAFEDQREENSNFEIMREAKNTEQLDQNLRTRKRGLQCFGEGFEACLGASSLIASHHCRGTVSALLATPSWTRLLTSPTSALTRFIHNTTLFPPIFSSRASCRDERFDINSIDGCNQASKPSYLLLRLSRVFSRPDSTEPSSQRRQQTSGPPKAQTNKVRLQDLLLFPYHIIDASFQAAIGSTVGARDKHYVSTRC